MVLQEAFWNRRKKPSDEQPAAKPEPENPEASARKAEESARAHHEALEFVEKHRDLLEQYSRGRVNFKAAPPGLNTFAFDLNEDTVYISPRFYEKQGLSDEKTAFATCHELEHFEEKRELLKEKDGAKVFERYLNRIQKSGAYKVMDNCVADVRENRAVVSKTNESFADVEHAMYTRICSQEPTLLISHGIYNFRWHFYAKPEFPEKSARLHPKYALHSTRSKV